ncbi:MAG: sugar ABC transporter ATP-binding protein, partial [Chloroflexota bacterium]|nr:sugar ABC transporter ATP-binding protein [Chloroflexota bacterium]
IHGLLGENGAGKSTLVKILSGAQREFDGELRLRGAPVRFDSPADAKLAAIGMVYQELSLFKPLSVAENIFSSTPPSHLGPLRAVDWQRLYREARQHLLELGLDVDERTQVGLLPVGVQQMVEIARVLFSGAEVIILDEPTSALSPPEAERLFAFVERLRAQGRSIILITHFIEDALRVADRITILKNGRKIATLPSSGTSMDDVIRLMIGEDARILRRTYEEEHSRPRRTVAQPGQVVLEVKGLSRRGVFDEVSFAVRAGEILGIYGYVGAGHSDVANSVFGLRRPDGGEIRLDGKPVHIRSATHAKGLGFGYVPENRRTALSLRNEVYKNISIAHLGTLTGFLLKPKREIGIAREQIERVGIRPADPLLPVGALSGGNQQKTLLAKWLVRQPRLLILVEPTRGMDVGAKDEVLQTIQELRDQGVAVLLISSEPETIIANCDRTLVMSKGRISQEFSADEVTKALLLRSA